MANLLPDYLFDSAEDERMRAAAEEERRKYAEAFRASQSRKAFLAAKRENEKLIRTARAVGAEPPEEPQQGWLSRTMDILDTSGQMVRGVAAKLADVPEFSNKGFLDAALYGDEKDLTTGDILRAKDILQGEDWGSKIGRGLAGFAGDVFSDPLNYVSLGTSGLARTGGAAVTSKLLQSAKYGEGTVAQVVGRHADDLRAAATSALMKKAEKGLLEPNALADEIAKAEITAERLSQNPIRAIRANLEKKALVFKQGIQDTEVGRAAIADADAAILDHGLKKLGLAADTDVNELFAKKAIRFGAPFPGLMSGWANIPLVNARNSVDIPLVTEWSEKAFDKLGRGLYNASVKVGQALDNRVKLGASNDARLWQKAIAKAIETPKTVFKGAAEAISSRARIGNKFALEDIREHEAALAGVIKNNMTRAEALSKGLSEEDFKLASGIIESGLRQHLDKNGRIALNAKDVVYDKKIFNEYAQKAAASLDELSPGKGRRFLDVITQIQDDFAAMRQEGVGNGILSSALDEGYVRRIIRPKPGMSLSEKEVSNFIRSAQKSGDGYDFARTYITSLEAQARGLDVNTNLLDSWLERRISHDTMMAEKRLMDRMAIETGVGKRTYDAIKNAVAGANDQEAKAAFDLLQASGVNLPPEGMKKLIGETLGLKRTTRGDVLTPEHYDFLRKIISENPLDPALVETALSKKKELGALSKYGKSIATSRAKGIVPKGVASGRLRAVLSQKDALRAEIGAMNLDHSVLAAYDEAAKLGLKFDDAEREAVVNGFNTFKRVKDRTLGRAGENFFDRAGASPLTNRSMNLLKKQLANLPQDKENATLLNFFGGVLPNSVVRAIDEMHDTRSTVLRLKDWAKDDRARQALAGFAEGTIGWTKLMKMWTTQVFPAYHAQNLSGSFFQAAHVLPTIASALNPVNIMKNHLLLKDGGKLIQEGTGREFTARQISDMLTAFGVRTKFGDSIDAIGAQANALEAITVWKRKPTGAWGKTKSAFQNLSSMIENVGREHTFIELLRQGHAPEDAARLANQALIDYSRNKTPFERNILNHFFFFYSFPKNQTANTLIALGTKPGAITAQLHAVNGVRDMLANDEELNDIPNIDDAMMSLRARETFGRVIGKDAQGMPEVLSDIGVPIKDLSRMMSIQFPEKMTLGSILEAGGESVQRTAQLIGSQANPVLKTAFELAIGKNLFFNRPITDKTIRKLPKLSESAAQLMPYGYQKIPRAVGDFIDAATWKWLNPVDNGDGTVTVDPIGYTLLTDLFPPLARAAQSVKVAGKEGVPFDHKLLRLLTGAKINSIDFQKSGVYDRNRQLESFFEKRALPTSKAQLGFFQQNNPDYGDELDAEAEDLLDEE